MRKYILFLLIVLMNAVAFGQTNNCNTSGTQITVNASCIPQAFDNTLNGNYWTSFAGCTASNNDDVWGYFIATSTSTTITYYSADNAILHVFNATCAATMTQIACANATTSGN